MKEKIQCLPLPIGGVALALFSLAKLLLAFDMTILAYSFIAIGTIIFTGLILKLVLVPEHVLTDMQNVMIVAVMPTWTMALMTVSTLWHTTFWDIVWYVAVFSHFAFMLYFTYRFVVKVEVHLTDVYPSWLIMYIGMGVMPLTAGNALPTLMTCVSIACVGFAIILIPLMMTRIVRGDLPTPTRPLIGILAAPVSLITAGYIAHAQTPYQGLVIAGLIVGQLLYMFVLTQLPRLLRLPFFPTYAALTFPLVISATASLNALSYLHVTMMWAQMIVTIETFIAIVMVSYVTVRYAMAMYKQMRATSMASV